MGYDPTFFRPDSGNGRASPSRGPRGAGMAPPPPPAPPRSSSDETRGAADKAASRIADAEQRFRTQAEWQKDQLATRVGSVADAIHCSGERLREQEESGLSEYADRLGDAVQRVADQIERRDMSELLGEVESFARRNPAVFLGGAALLGLGAARFLKSSDARRHDDEPYADTEPFGARGGHRAPARDIDDRAVTPVPAPPKGGSTHGS